MTGTGPLQGYTWLQHRRHWEQAGSHGMSWRSHGTPRRSRSGSRKGSFTQAEPICSRSEPSPLPVLPVTGIQMERSCSAPDERRISDLTKQGCSPRNKEVAVTLPSSSSRFPQNSFCIPFTPPGSRGSGPCCQQDTPGARNTAQIPPELRTHCSALSSSSF